MASHRGFQDEFYHDEHIIDQWNRVVQKRDIVWILGDITMGTDKYYYQLDRLMGEKRVLLGNHDLPKHVPELLKYVTQVAGVLQYKGFLCTHTPVHPKEIYDNNFKNPWRGNIHGHTHEVNMPEEMYFNVSVEAINYRPVTLETIVNTIKERRSNVSTKRLKT